MLKKNTLLFSIFLSLVLQAQAFAFNPRIMSAETITLRSRGLDVVDVLQMISEKGHFNLSVSSNVSGKVTLFLRDVSIDEAFDIVLKSADLVCEIDENITYIMTQAEFKQRYGKDYKNKSEMKVFRLENAQAEKVGQVLTKVASADAKVVSDERTNTVVLFDQLNRIEELSNIVNKLDNIKTSNDIEYLKYPTNKVEYYINLVERIRSIVPRWYFKSSSTKVRVRFVLSQYGELIGHPEIMTFSAQKYWQDLAKKVIVDATPFMPFPVDMKSKEEIFEIELAL